MATVPSNTRWERDGYERGIYMGESYIVMDI